jgi:hypothetical protein
MMLKMWRLAGEVCFLRNETILMQCVWSTFGAFWGMRPTYEIGFFAGFSRKDSP